MMLRGSLVLVDTNVLLTATDSSRPGFKEARELFTRALASGVHLCVSGQIIREYLVVATRPATVNGLGLSFLDAIHNVQALQRRLVFLEESELVSSELLSLVQKYELSGKRIHDANIVALMHAERISLLISCDPKDFSLFSTIEVLPPEVFLQRLGE
jgi:predicted nucleic acid-binding protein